MQVTSSLPFLCSCLPCCSETLTILSVCNNQVRQIARNGQTFAREHLTPAHVLCYHVRLFEVRSKVLPCEDACLPFLNSILALSAGTFASSVTSSYYHIHLAFSCCDFFFFLKFPFVNISFLEKSIQNKKKVIEIS